MQKQMRPPYQTLSFTFDGRNLDHGTFILKTDGDLEVFELSLLPTDHFYGMRRDVIEHLKSIAPTSIRFPGGCAADHFDWKESLKSREFRTPTDGSSKSWFLFRNTYDQDPLDIGLNEFLMLCRELNAEPEYTVSLLLSDGEDARRLVEYCNGDANTEYGAKRQALGFDAFHIPLWYIGNEAYFFGGIYKDSAAAAALRTNELTHVMLTADNSISVVMGLTWGEDFKQWSREFTAHLDCPYDYLSFHDYIGILPDPTQGHNGMATCELVEDIFLDGESAGLNFYKHDLLPDQFLRLKVCADEWNYSWGYDSSNAQFLSNALQFHFLAKSGEKYNIERAQFFLPVNEGMITVHGAESKLESSGELFRLMKPHMNGMIIDCSADTTDLDILCTEHETRHCYMSIVNRRAVPLRIVPKG
ncbi:MAG: hypothetical protein IKC46_00010 [Lachnospiraceae bacterium]|nr:hypothetical protein [Lachnospiraceae bacterium]